MKKFALGALALALMAGAAQAAIVPTTVTATGNYGNDLAVINDGFFPANGTFYADPVNVYFGGDFDGPSATFTYDFGGAYALTGVQMTLDNNDDYLFDFYNGATYLGTGTIFASEGSVAPNPGGMDNFSRSVFATVTSVVVSGANGDGLFSIGEVQFEGSAAVPEPATWSMLLAGFFGAGALLRRRRTLALTA